MRKIKLDDVEKILIGFAREIVAYLVKTGIPPSQAEDVVQDVFVKMLESDFVIPAEKMRAWMYRVSIRKYIDNYRRDRRYMEILQEDFFKESQMPALPFEGEDYEFLLEEVRRLSISEQVLLDLYYFQGFSTKEIASILGISLSKVKVDLLRSRKKLRQALEKKGYKNGNI